MKRILLIILFAISFQVVSVSAIFGQTENKNLKVGDQVEATYAGEWKSAVIVGSYQDSGYGYGTYQIHFDGDKYCNNHALDSRIDARYVRLRPSAATNRTPANTPNQNDLPETRKNPISTSSSGQKFKIGDRVNYTDGYIFWSGPGEIVSYDAEKRQYTVRDVKDLSWKYTYACYAVIKPGQFNNNFYIGKWDVRITGAISTFSHNGKTYRQFSGGMNLPPLEVKADGTYTWRLSANEMINGRWKDREGAPGITLLNAINSEDYTLYEKTEASATTEKTRDEIGIIHLPSKTGYYMAYRIGENKSCVLTGRTFTK